MKTIVKANQLSNVLLHQYVLLSTCRNLTWFKVVLPWSNKGRAQIFFVLVVAKPWMSHLKAEQVCYTIEE